MSMFSMIEFADDGHNRLMEILANYRLSLTDDEIAMIKYGCLGDRYRPYIPVVSKVEQRRLKKLLSTERHFITRHSFSRTGKKKVQKTPTSIKWPDKIALKYGRKEYKFLKDDSIKELFTKFLEQLLSDDTQGNISLIKQKDHFFKSLVAHLFEYLISITSSRANNLSKNKILHLTYDLMALSYPSDFSDLLIIEDKGDRDRHKASRITSIIKVKLKT